MTQNIEYFPSGETFVENHRNSNYSPYKFNGKELDAETGYYYGARYYNPRFSLWLNVDPLAEAFPGRSPYEYTFSNPVRFTDPTGMAPEQEFPDLYKGKLGKGDWRESDRLKNTKTWENANAHNLQQKNGSSEYTTISQRTDFYKWFQNTTESKGFETYWAGAAYIVASQMSAMDNSLVQMVTSDELISFANQGNKAIFDDVFDNLRGLVNGPVLKGENALQWDKNTLYNEQYNVVQPIYLKQSPETQQSLDNLAKGKGIKGALGALGGGSNNQLNFKGTDIMQPSQRFDHGMKVAAPFYKKYKSIGGAYLGGGSGSVKLSPY